jgi:hypothetical protein
MSQPIPEPDPDDVPPGSPPGEQSASADREQAAGASPRGDQPAAPGGEHAAAATEPGPASTEPASTEPASTEPASTEPASTEPASSESASGAPASGAPPAAGSPAAAAAPGAGSPAFVWVPGSELPGVGPVDGPVPPEMVTGGGGLPAGLDWRVLLDALAAGGFLDGREEDQDAELADELAAEVDGRMGPSMDVGQVAALAVEHMDPGPAQAGWLSVATAVAGDLDEYGLAGVTMAGAALASWAQAAELTAVAQITARAAAADSRIGILHDGRPARLCRDALGQVGLALRLTDYGAGWWADLAITLSWRLPATGAALEAGRIDLDRARKIAEATSVLSEELARVVEAKVLPRAGRQTVAELVKRLRHAVIAVDPDGAERRRQRAERGAQVCLFADDDGTATLAGSKLPAVEASAAMARITAIARSMKAAGQAGGLDVHRAKVMLGLLLGTLPYIPPADGAPPDPPPPSPGDHGSSGPGSGGPGGGPDRPGSGDGADNGPCPGGGPSQDLTGHGPAGRPGPRGEDTSPGDHLGDLPAPRDEDAPPEDGLDDLPGVDQGGQWDPAEDDDDLAGTRPVPWPGLGIIPPALARPTPPQPGRPVPGLLDVTLPWTTLAGLDHQPGLLSRIGPITPAQTRQLATTAQHDPAAQWRIIITNPDGHAIATTRLRRPKTRAGPGPARGDPATSRGSPAQTSGDAGPARDRLLPGTGLTGRITLIISHDTIRQHTQTPGAPGSPELSDIAAAALRAAARALEHALAQAQADTDAAGCAHADESAAYRPPPRIREYVIARDQTCTYPTCGQPAWRADLDHTTPYDDGGRTCRCNLGGRCRKHHILKQHPRWTLTQNPDGTFTWTTPAGRSYTTRPHTYTD